MYASVGSIARVIRIFDGSRFLRPTHATDHHRIGCLDRPETSFHHYLPRHPLGAFRSHRDCVLAHRVEFTLVRLPSLLDASSQASFFVGSERGT
jgi:hypothetical protein